MCKAIAQALFQKCKSYSTFETNNMAVSKVRYTARMAKKGKAKNPQRPSAATTAPSLQPQTLPQPQLPPPPVSGAVSESNTQSGSTNVAHKKHWFNDFVDSPGFSGVLALIAFAFSFSPKANVLATWFCLAAAWALTIRGVYQLEHVRSKPKKRRYVITIIAGLVALLIYAFLGWWLVLPSKTTVTQAESTPPSSTSTASSPAPSPSQEANEPKFDLYLPQTLVQYNGTLDLTEILVQVNIRNLGAPSAVPRWRVHYKSPTLNTDLSIIRPLHEPKLFPLSKDSKEVIKFYYADSINEKTAVSPVTKEVPLQGRFLLNVPGDRTDEVGSGKAEITVTAYDYLGRTYKALYKGGGGDQKINILPKDIIEPRPRKKRHR